MPKDLEKILELMDELRQKLHSLAYSRSFTDQEVINASEKFNNAMNEYYRLLQQKKKRDY